MITVSDCHLGSWDHFSLLNSVMHHQSISTGHRLPFETVNKKV